MRFADEAFEKAVREKLGVDTVESAAQLEAISAICIIGAHSLDDLVYFTGLKQLTLTSCEVKDASPLRRMGGLISLSLHRDNGINAHDIAPLTGLECLLIDRCGEMDISPLAALTGLKDLTIWYAGVRDVSPLKGMTQMEMLSLHNNPVEDIAPLRSMKHLNWLTVDTEHLKDRRIFLEKPFSHAYKGCTDFPENSPKNAKKKPAGRPKLTYLANVHPRLPFCRDAALFRLTGGQERLVCRDLGEQRKRDFDLYLDDKPLAEVYINKSLEFSCHFRGGCGDGLSNEPSCRAVRDQINEGFHGLRDADKYLAPYISLMESGLYVAADFDMFPVCGYGGEESDYFWDAPEYSNELHFCHGFIGGSMELRTPLFLAPTRRAADVNAERVEYYRARLREGSQFPRAVALFLNGGVALLLDGHHKAAACAMDGTRVPTLVIYRLDDNIDISRIEAAVTDGVRLYMQRSTGYPVPIALCDGRDNVLGRFSCLEKMKKTRLYIEPVKLPEWGRAPDELRTESFRSYPSVSELVNIGELMPNEMRSLIEQEKVKPRGEHNIVVIHLLRNYAEMFPESKWLSPDERAWLSLPDDKFEDYGFEVEYPNKQ